MLLSKCLPAHRRHRYDSCRCVAIVAYDLYSSARYRRALAAGVPQEEPEPVRWRTTVALALLAWAPMLIAFSIVLVPSGRAGVRVSQLSGTRPGTLYPGVHLVKPLVETIEVFDSVTDFLQLD